MLAKLAPQKNTQITYEYVPEQDMLYIEFEPVHEDTYYQDIPDVHRAMFRYTLKGDRLVGISALFIEKRLGTNQVTDTMIRDLALDLIRESHLERLLEGA